jgi:MazG family protein
MSIDELLRLMARLRAPEGGCPWDLQQTFATVAPYTIEEAYEVADAIERGEMAELREELGDLLFQVVFHAQMASEAGAFGFDEVVAGIVEKMTRRHPHVFGGEQVTDASEQTERWEEQKARERSAKAETDPSLLDDVPRALPALSRAHKLQKRAARAGFDWPGIEGVFEKVQEEIEELRAELDVGDSDRLADELGDLLFSCVNLARHAGVDPETALRGANAKFERRFRAVEEQVRAGGHRPEELDLEALDAHWESVKSRE